MLKIKGSKYTIKDLLDDEMSAEYFRGGTCLVFRLTVDDNHRYNFIDSGKRLSTKKIRGELHTVRPISEKYDVYTRNSREVSILDTEELGIVAQIEVGALLVGRIVNHDKASFVKNEEKGYFEYGGSTIVVLLNKKLEIDPDIAAMNENGIETKVKAGEKLGLILE